MARSPRKSPASKSAGSSRKSAATAGSGPEAAPPELVVMMRPESAFRASAGRFESLSGDAVGDLEKTLAKFDATMAPLFGHSEERQLADLRASSERAEQAMLDTTIFYTVDAPAEKLRGLQEALAKQPVVDAAYIKPGAELPALNDMQPTGADAPPVTPDFVPSQIYLNPAPAGVDAIWAWTQAGGRGNDVRVIDIEGAWRFTHEDLTQIQGGVVGGTESADIGWRNHGTAVLGEFSGDINGFGITGISPEAHASAISIFGGMGSAGALNAAAGRLRAGDIILIELHRPGPRHAFAVRSDQAGYIAIEWWPDDFTAIRNAVNRGILVIEAAGNGAENLDDAIYQTPGPGFPASWSNSFRRSNRDSGAIVVGAGAPPPGTHGRDHGPDRSRLGFSNFGALVDAQGWGREVTTCGYGNLQGGPTVPEDLWYTDTFSGTSSASPIIVGVCATIQGMARARGVAPLTPARMRDCLRSTGSAQQDAPGRPATQRIGNRPDIRQLATCAFGIRPKTLKDLKDAAKDRIKDGVKELKERPKELKDAAKELKERPKELKEKEIKEGKEKEFKEGKELKEGIKEIKEGKELKEGIKEVKEGKEVKELEKRIKEKDKDKDLVENKLRDKIQEVIGRGGLGGGGPAAGDTDARLAALEESVGALMHFIGGELRPDLSQSALDADDWSDDGTGM